MDGKFHEGHDGAIRGLSEGDKVIIKIDGFGFAVIFNSGEFPTRLMLPVGTGDDKIVFYGNDHRNRSAVLQVIKTLTGFNLVREHKDDKLEVFRLTPNKEEKKTPRVARSGLLD